MKNQKQSTPEPIILAGDQRLSQSLIWQIQRRYFQQEGMNAWQQNVVPHQISSNPMMARAYSQVVLGYLRDCLNAAQNGRLPLNPDQPLYIVELGAGSGRLAHHFLHQFRPLLADSPLADQPVCYVMTDFVPGILDFWQRQPRFQQWAAAGWLDFALFDVIDRRPLILRQQRQTLSPDRLQNPLILIANYFFDSIPQDSFTIVDGQLCENLLTVTSSQPEPNLADPTLWDRLDLQFEAVPMAKPYYPTPIYNRILDEYEISLPDTAFSFPNMGLDCIRYWQGFGNGRGLLLTADRGYLLAESLLQPDDSLPNLHGSFSLMVNYHAITRYLELTDGLALVPPQYQDNLQVAAYLWGPLPGDGQETRHAFHTAVTNGGPDDFYALKEALTPHLHTFTLPQILSYLRLYAWDADRFRDCFPTLLARVQAADPVWYEDVYRVIQQIWQQYLPLQEPDDLAGQIRQLLAVMGMEFVDMADFGSRIAE